MKCFLKNDFSILFMKLSCIRVVLQIDILIHIKDSFLSLSRTTLMRQKKR